MAAAAAGEAEAGGGSSSSGAMGAAIGGTGGFLSSLLGFFANRENNANSQKLQSNQIDFETRFANQLAKLSLNNTSTLMNKQFNQSKEFVTFQTNLQGNALQSMGLPQGAWALGPMASALPHTTQMVAPGSFMTDKLPGDPTIQKFNGGEIQQAIGVGNATGIGF
jgi:hypothetical protein